jgi:hypothetical protein|mmetsp:Transcript_364/g.1504  ORF Transcript_364/g.1504 Transcript_364/m.1504 type:complete len:237 (+) Transcript_364:45-755(+)
MPAHALASRAAIARTTTVTRVSTTSRRASVCVRAVVMDPVTKISFPDTERGQVCLGAGARTKRVAILDVKVYALALYVDGDKAKAAKALGLLKGAYDKTLRITLARDVDGKDFASALDEALAPRLREIATNMATKEDENGDFMATTAEAAEKAEEKANDELEALSDAFSGIKLKSGTNVIITWTPNASKKASIDIAGDVVEFESEELALALLDTYVGDAPVSPGARDAFNKGLSAL